MLYLIYVIRLLFICYTLMIFIRIIGSWFPNLRYHKFIRFIAFYTDPYLNLFRRFIPPIGGTLDLSPLVAFIVLRLVEKFIIMLLLS